MAKIMKRIAYVTIILMVVFIVIYKIKPFKIFFSLSIVAGTTAYHFWMRLLIGGVFDFFLKNKVDFNHRWFKVSKKEQRIYETLRVKQWKKYFPTYDPATFDRRQHSWGEIAAAMCQSELVHETIVVLSFLPIFLSFRYGSILIFIITSLISALFDFLFVVIQRYNRPRILKIIK